MPLPTHQEFSQFFNEDYLRNLAASATFWAMGVVATAMSGLAIVAYRALRPHALSIVRTVVAFVAMALFFLLGMTALQSMMAGLEHEPSAIAIEPKFR